MKNSKLLVGLAVGIGLYLVFKNKNGDDGTRIVNSDAEALRTQLDKALSDLEEKMNELSAAQNEIANLQSDIEGKNTIIQQQITEIASLEAEIAELLAYDDPQIPILEGAINEIQNLLDEEIIKVNDLETNLFDVTELATIRQNRS